MGCSKVSILPGFRAPRRSASRVCFGIIVAARSGSLRVVDVLKSRDRDLWVSQAVTTHSFVVCLFCPANFRDPADGEVHR
eukprot:9469932-Pyramimonas_sp.AAC.1